MTHRGQHGVLRLVLPALLGIAVSAPGAIAQDAGQVPQAQAARVPADASELQDGALPARLSYVEGEVRVAAAAAAAPVSDSTESVPPPPADAVYSHATANMPVLPGARIETGDQGRAEVQFNDGNLARITPTSSARLDSLNNAGEQVSSLSGLAYYEVPGQTSGQMTIRVGSFTLTPALNSLVRVDMDARPFQVTALRGTVLVESNDPDTSFNVDEGQAAVLDANDPNGYRLLQQVASNSWDQWNADRDDALSEMAQGQTSARDGSGNADADAWNDLDYYGTWYDVPGAGEAWSPDGVSNDFDPYGNGAWGYYSGVGYTWISAYPWGWLPYHCGNWNYFTGFGWMWQPVGSCGAYAGGGWFPYTGISHAPRGYRMPLYGAAPHRVPRTRLGGVPIGPVQPVHRGPEFRFRSAGGARPEPRALPLSGPKHADSPPSYARTLPVIQMPVEQYGAPSAFAGHAAAGPGRPVYIPHRALQGSVISPTPRAFSPTPRAISPTPRAISPTPRAISPTPRAISPTPRVYSPPPRTYSPPPRMEAPHMSMPHASAPAGHGH